VGSGPRCLGDNLVTGEPAVTGIVMMSPGTRGFNLGASESWEVDSGIVITSFGFKLCATWEVDSTGRAIMGAMAPTTMNATESLNSTMLNKEM
jgi:hypothetical protein